MTAELAQREDWYAMGRFVGELAPDAMRAAVAQLDDRALLEVAFVLEDRNHLPRLIAQLPAARLRAVIACAARDGLWPPTLDLLPEMGPAALRSLPAIGGIGSRSFSASTAGCGRGSSSRWPPCRRRAGVRSPAARDQPGRMP